MGVRLGMVYHERHHTLLNATQFAKACANGSCCYASQAGNGVVVSALLATGATAQVRLQDAAGDTPLVLAGRNGHAQVSAAQTPIRAS